MKDSNPLVSIGLPIYNGENYLEDALKSILAQSYSNFELIISDNASTDRTQAICDAYAASDSRIRYYRSEENKGAAWNFNRVFNLSRGKYFNWLAHDDIIKPTYLEKCVAVLEKDPSIILCHSQVYIVNENQEVLHEHRPSIRTDSFDPLQRFHDALLELYLCFEIFGLIRVNQQWRKPILVHCAHGDGILLERLALEGRFYEIPEFLFLERRHPEQSMEVYRQANRNRMDYHGYTRWFDPETKDSIILPTWRMLGEHIRSIWNGGLNLRDQLLTYFYLLKWMGRRKRPLVTDLLLAVKQTLDRLF